MAVGLMSSIGGCSSGTNTSSPGNDVIVVAGSSAPSNADDLANASVAFSAPAPTPAPTTSPPPMAMPLPKYVPGPPLPPELQKAEDDIKRAALRAAPPAQPD